VEQSEAKPNVMKLYKQVDNKVELCIPVRLEPEVKKLFAKEINSGYREALPDGRIYFVFEITPEKATLLHWVSRWIEDEGSRRRGFVADQQKNAS
jgi:hypothetical protein